MFTDEQLLNLVNNTIIEKTKNKIEDFTGGSVQLTSTNKHQLQKYKVSLFFGYTKSKNSINSTLEIEENLVNIWIDAIMLKIKSLQVRNNGSEFKELNRLMNTKSDSSKVVSNKVDSNKVVVVSSSRGSTIGSDEVVLPENKTTTTTVPTEFEDYFNSKNFTNVSFKDEFLKFKHYNSNINNQTILNWMRWVDNIKVTSTTQIEKQDYSWSFKKLQSGSESIAAWYFTQTQQQLPTYLNFDFEKFKEIGISCVRLEHPTMPKQVTIYYKLGADGEKILKQIGNKNEN
ncbi:MAG: hypothetical protein WA945_10235 [Arcobacteraceae bacterium]